MKTRLIRCLIGWSALLIPVSAGAVATDLHLNGQPTECKIVLKQGGKTQTVKTDTGGHAKVDLVPNEPVTVTTKNYDYAPIPVTETPSSQGGIFEIPVAPSAPLVQNPSGFGSFGVAPRYDGDYLRHMKVTEDSFTFGGKTVFGNGHNEPDTSFDMNEGAVDIPIGLPPVHLYDHTMLYFTPVFLAGGATFDLKFRDRTSDMTTKFSGSGAVLGGGFNSTIMGTDCPWFGGVDVLYRTNLNPSVSRNNSIETVHEKDELSFDQWNAGVRGGYNFATGMNAFRSVAPWAGVAFNSTNLTLKGTQESGATTASFKNEIAANDFLGQVGVDTHLWGPIFARSQVTFNDEDVSVMAKLVYQFDICDWFD